MPNRRLPSLLSIAPVALLALVLGPAPVVAQVVDPTFRADIEKLLEVTGASQNGAQIANLVSGQVLDGMKRSRPDIPARAVEIAKEVVQAEFLSAFSGPQGLSSAIVDIYEKHFTHEDVRGLLAFYETDLGRKAIKLLPVVIQESALAGQQWAEQNMPRIIKVLDARLRAEGFIK
jgi:hypothetical protein